MPLLDMFFLVIHFMHWVMNLKRYRGMRINLYKKRKGLHVPPFYRTPNALRTVLIGSTKLISRSQEG